MVADPPWPPQDHSGEDNGGKEREGVLNLGGDAMEEGQTWKGDMKDRAETGQQFSQTRGPNNKLEFSSTNVPLEGTREHTKVTYRGLTRR